MKNKAFTLIELLIVVAIISILAAIAVPNFLEAQMRAKTSRVLSDLRSIKVGLESYSIDYGTYLLDGNDYPKFDLGNFNCKRNLMKLTTPIAYLSTIFSDPFHHSNKDSFSKILTPDPPPYPYIYMTFQGYSVHNGTPEKYYLFSLGPDQDFENDKDKIYDPTNGTVSDGDIIVSGP